MNVFVFERTGRSKTQLNSQKKNTSAFYDPSKYTWDVHTETSRKFFFFDQKVISRVLTVDSSSDPVIAVIDFALRVSSGLVRFFSSKYYRRHKKYMSKQAKYVSVESPFRIVCVHAVSVRHSVTNVRTQNERREKTNAFTVVKFVY